MFYFFAFVAGVVLSTSVRIAAYAALRTMVGSTLPAFNGDIASLWAEARAAAVRRERRRA
jgi:hypothetical protein